MGDAIKTIIIVILSTIIILLTYDSYSKIDEVASYKDVEIVHIENHGHGAKRITVESQSMEMYLYFMNDDFDEDIFSVGEKYTFFTTEGWINGYEEGN